MDKISLLKEEKLKIIYHPNSNNNNNSNNNSNNNNNSSNNNNKLIHNHLKKINKISIKKISNSHKNKNQTILFFHQIRIINSQFQIKFLMLENINPLEINNFN